MRSGTWKYGIIQCLVNFLQFRLRSNRTKEIANKAVARCLTLKDSIDSSLIILELAPMPENELYEFIDLEPV